MYCDLAVLASLPRLLTSEDLCRALHMNKQTALGLVHSGLLPMVVEQRHNCCFSVRKSDLEALMTRLERCPDTRPIFAQTLRRSVSEGYQHQIRVLPPTVSKSALRQFYEAALADWPQVLRVQDICRFTGYRRSAVRNWMLRGELACLTREPRCLVPKSWLINYLCSEQYNHKARKSDAHVRQLWEAYQELSAMKPSNAIINQFGSLP